MAGKILYCFIIAIIVAGCMSNDIYNKTLQDYDRTVAQSEARKSSIEKRLDNHANDILRQIAQIAGTGPIESIDELAKVFKALKKDNEQLKEKIETLTAERDAASKDRAGLAGQVEALKKEKEIQAAESQKDIALAKKDNDLLNEKIAALTSERDVLSKDRAGLAGQVEALKKEKEILAESPKEAALLKKDNDQLKEKMAAVTSEKDMLSKDKEGLAKKIEDISAEMDAIKKEKVALADVSQKEIDGLKQRVHSQDEEINAMKKERDELAGKADYLNKEIARLKLKAGEIDSEKEKEVAALKDTYDKLLEEMKGEIERGEIKIKQTVDRLSVNMVDRVLFDSGSASVKPEGQKILNRVGAILKGIRDKEIKVDGHADNQMIGPELKDKYPTNWELSSTRATNVVRYLQDRIGIPPELLAASGYSKYRPIATNKTEEGRAQNRRIEILLLPRRTDAILNELRSDSR